MEKSFTEEVKEYEENQKLLIEKHEQRIYEVIDNIYIENDCFEHETTFDIFDIFIDFLVCVDNKYFYKYDITKKKYLEYLLKNPNLTAEQKNEYIVQYEDSD